MPPLLGAADSFNSSAATIKAGNTADSSRDRRNNPSSSNPLRPQDSVGREFEALINGRVGLLQNDDGFGNAELLSRYLRESHTLPGEISLSNPPADTTTFNPLSFIADPAAPDVNFFADSEFETTSSAFAFQQPAPLPQTISPAVISGPSAGSSASPFERPTSAASHRSHHSNFSCSTTEGSGSYVTTDDDGDDVMNHTASAAASPSPLNEIGALNISSSTTYWSVGPSSGVQTIAPTAQALGSSARNAPPSAPSSTASSSRRRSHAVSFPEEEDDNKRQARLEHRRSINRRSAQKHRLRRKEELEDLSRMVAERDKRIQELERELAVAKGNLETLMSLVKRNKQGA
ncbi:hypothetical protein CC85DRAFT_284509 [Cutaneotrichosporon oleaginosum]|uniref:BZIP domain-containing protein n=1 Tax=Cutaneotrichosporon oleaginosum TaxID=879819 RepID=A0A0J0XQK4_9TREE|nr:uncharacterized protein CC85DRAFT_284509 [Cutaneotrichosporon oleaginosum]KLT43362.1 hypothetical protein CC85DRAFT_284509 [Cutaneotrichosporon oleaginosum]TXT05422.1 hypothetical protein COLE_06742 [Cutaneotrichosporon oleaginosum]